MAEAARIEEDPAALLQAAADLLRCDVGEVADKAEALAAEVKRLEDEAKAKAGGWAEMASDKSALSEAIEGPFK